MVVCDKARIFRRTLCDLVVFSDGETQYTVWVPSPILRDTATVYKETEEDKRNDKLQVLRKNLEDARKLVRDTQFAIANIEGDLDTNAVQPASE